MIRLYIQKLEPITEEDIKMARSLPYDKFNERSGPQNVIEGQKVVDLLETVITNEQFEKIRKLMIEFF